LRQATTRESDPRQRLAALADAFLRFGLDYPACYRLMFMQRPDFLLTCRAGEKEPLVTSIRQIADGAVRAAMEAGALPKGDIQAMSDLLWAQAHGIISLAIHFPQFDHQRVRDAFHAVLALWGCAWEDIDPAQSA
ncbi:MAG TPA: TetR-like C-terminal domain-containing protein, partial [Ktedonobacterales bacterium]|nr:TetR-like C-terminal domain-containing protein [Ktedonobacterales bacterium]